MTATAEAGVRIRIDIVIAPAPRVAAAPTRRRRGFRAVLGFAAALIALNALLAILVDAAPVHLRDPEYGLRLKSLRAKRADHPDRKLTIVLGSSRTAIGIRPDVYEASLAHPENAPLLFNMSMSGAGPILQLLTLERLLADGVKPDALLIEFWPAVYRGDGPYREDRRINAERLRSADLPIVDRFFTDPDATKERLRASRIFPAWHLRRELLIRSWPDSMPWKDRNDGSWSTLDGWGWLPGRTNVTAEQVERGWPDVAAFYAPLYRDYSVAPVADRALRALLARCRELGIPATLIGLPESTRFRGLQPPEAIQLSEDYRLRIERECGVPFLDGRTWGRDAALPDGFHLMQDGAKEFTRKLTGQLVPPN